MGWTFDPHHTVVGFSAKHLGITTERGIFKEIAVDVELDDDGNPPPRRAGSSSKLPASTPRTSSVMDICVARTSSTSRTTQTSSSSPSR